MIMAKLNELIRCEDAIKEICKRTCTPGVLCPDAYCKEVKEWITDDMVVDAVPVVHGEWRETWASGLDGVRRWSWCCSECGYEPYYFHDVHTLNYCPNCGAKMAERREGESDGKTKVD